MSDHNEAPSTEDEIEDVISEAKKAAKAQNPNKSGKSKRNRNRNRNRNKTKAQDEESSENLFDEIDSVADADDDDENLSPKMKSAKEFSNAFAAAKVKREKNLKTKRAEQEVSDEEDDEEDVIFEPDDEEEYDDDSAAFEVDSEDEEYEEDDDDEYDGIFETDDENEEYIENVDVDDDDEEDFDDDDEDYDDDDEDDDDYDDDEDDEDDDDDDEEGTFSTKAKVIIGIIIAILVLAIIGAGIFFLNRGGDETKKDNTTSQVSDGSVTGIQFKEPSVSLRVGETVPLEIIVEPESAKDKVLKLKSNDPTIAKVDETGKLTGVASGSTTVTATLKSNETITASLIVNVIDDDQDAINIYNKFVNSIIDGSTDIDSDVDTDEEDEQEEQQYDEFGNPIESSDTDSDSDSAANKTTVVKDTLTGNIIKDLDNDGNLELALLYKDAHDSSNVRIFRLADPNEVEEETTDEEQQYDEFGNPIETEDTDSEAETDTEKNTDENSDERVLTEVAEGTELYTTCYEKIETEGASWNTSYVEIKEDESEQAKVTILSSGYDAPTYTYESEDSTIATVDAQGNIKAVKPGTTYVIVTSPLNSDAMAKIKVRVKDDTDLLDDYLAKIPKVNQTNDSVFPTETLTGKAIVDIDNDGVSELLLRFDYGNHVQAIEMVKVENEKCVVYKTYNNLSDLYEYNEGDGYYNNTILVHYTTGKVCMEYRAVVAKEDSRTKTSEQKILSVESGGNLSELVNFKTTTDITTKTVTSEVVVEDEEDTTSYDDESSAPEDDTSSVWYDDEDTDSDDEDNDTTSSEDEDDNNYYDNDYYSDLNNSLGRLTFKNLSEFDDDDDNNDDDTSSAASSSTANNNDDSSSRVTSTVTSEVSEETTKYFVNGTPVEQSVYEDTLSTYSARYSVWSAWETV